MPTPETLSSCASPRCGCIDLPDGLEENRRPSTVGTNHSLDTGRRSSHSLRFAAGGSFLKKNHLVPHSLCLHLDSDHLLRGDGDRPRCSCGPVLPRCVGDRCRIPTRLRVACVADRNTRRHGCLLTLVGISQEIDRSVLGVLPDIRCFAHHDWTCTVVRAHSSSCVDHVGGIDTGYCTVTKCKSNRRPIGHS